MTARRMDTVMRTIAKFFIVSCSVLALLDVVVWFFLDDNSAIIRFGLNSTVAVLLYRQLKEAS